MPNHHTAWTAADWQALQADMCDPIVGGSPVLHDLIETEGLAR